MALGAIICKLNRYYTVGIFVLWIIWFEIIFKFYIYSAIIQLEMILPYPSDIYTFSELQNDFL
jgi:hypothetical protein